LQESTIDEAFGKTSAFAIRHGFSPREIPASYRSNIAKTRWRAASLPLPDFGRHHVDVGVNGLLRLTPPSVKDCRCGTHPRCGGDLRIPHDGGEHAYRRASMLARKVSHLSDDLRSAAGIPASAWFPSSRASSAFTCYRLIIACSPCITQGEDLRRSNEKFRLDVWLTCLDGSTVLHSSTGGDATGLGDVILRSKYNLIRDPGSFADLAIYNEIKLPTGDQNNLLGTGNTDALAMAIISKQIGTFAPHLNLGYQIAMGKGTERYNVGVDVSVLDSVNLSGEVVGQKNDVGLNLADFVMGAKWNFWDRATLIGRSDQQDRGPEARLCVDGSC
jgi:hypothetical protein